MNALPPNKSRGLRDALEMIVFRGIEGVTRALLMGDGFDLDALTPLINRMRACVAAYDKRMEEVSHDPR